MFAALSSPGAVLPLSIVALFAPPHLRAAPWPGYPPVAIPARARGLPSVANTGPPRAPGDQGPPLMRLRRHSAPLFVGRTSAPPHRPLFLSSVCIELSVCAHTPQGVGTVFGRTWTSGHPGDMARSACSVFFLCWQLLVQTGLDLAHKKHLHHSGSGIAALFVSYGWERCFLSKGATIPQPQRPTGGALASRRPAGAGPTRATRARPKCCLRPVPPATLSNLPRPGAGLGAWCAQRLSGSPAPWMSVPPAWGHARHWNGRGGCARSPRSCSVAPQIRLSLSSDRDWFSPC